MNNKLIILILGLFLVLSSTLLVSAYDVSQVWTCGNGGVPYCEERDCGWGKSMYGAGDDWQESTYLWFEVDESGEYECEVRVLETEFGYHSNVQQDENSDVWLNDNYLGRTHDIGCNDPNTDSCLDCRIKNNIFTYEGYLPASEWNVVYLWAHDSHTLIAADIKCDLIPEPVCEDGEIQNFESANYCEGLDWMLSESYDICSDDSWNSVLVESFIEDCSYDDIAYGEYSCEEDNRTREITYSNGVCDDSSGCSIENTYETEIEVCEFGCAEGECNEEVCEEGETRNEAEEYSCYDDDVWLNSSLEVCSLNEWVSIFDFSFYEDCFNDTIAYGEYSCEEDNRTREITTYNGFCDNDACEVEVGVDEEIEVCEFGCAEGECNEEVCEEGSWANFESVDYCGGSDLIDVWTNVSYDVCVDNEWGAVFDSDFNYSCSGDNEFINYYCIEYDLYENWSMPTCLDGSCGADYYSEFSQYNSTVCGWINETCDDPVPIITIITPEHGGEYSYTNLSVFAISDQYINQWFYSINDATSVEVFDQEGFNVSFYEVFIEGDNILRIWGVNETTGMGYAEFLISFGGECVGDDCGDDDDDDDDDYGSGSSSVSVYQTSAHNDTVPPVYSGLSLDGKTSSSGLGWLWWLLIILLVLAIVGLIVWIAKVI
ncbi:hypothetical protein CMI41_02680 [Candidatus Pacearchaeota archaeon]|nr:hypothetical protein [Candidatus Pacearchaeota archaeon]|tara:strand:+ start:14596 stop:16566 length:1971 start_codon:yes stop_codon:yes gene_type:complete